MKSFYRSDTMYRVTYYIESKESAIAFREFATIEEALIFVTALPRETLLEMKKYEDSIDN